MIGRRAWRRLRGDARGTSVMEFGLVAVPVVVMLLGLVDLGFRAYLASQLQGALDQAARMVTVGGVDPATVSAFITDRMQQILPGGIVTVVPESYTDFSGVGKPEPVTTDVNKNGKYDPGIGECFLDMNGNGVWDQDGGKSGSGGGDDIVYYTATVAYPALTPLGEMLDLTESDGPNKGKETVQATMMMRNQPYAAQAQPATKCK